MEHIELSGNNGGDYIKITQAKEQDEISCCNIQIGHCCVVLLDAQVPVEFITSLFADFMLSKRDGMSRSVDDKLSDFAGEVMRYGKKFVTERLSYVKERRC